MELLVAILFPMYLVHQSNSTVIRGISVFCASLSDSHPYNLPPVFELFCWEAKMIAILVVNE